ncbi:MAG: heavy metal translocating P-type ATPase [Gemmatimonadaceae bacterium]|nr:heavy metal translocating P-type ATPase [Gemmatimonadaceae bacterium]
MSTDTLTPRAIDTRAGSASRDTCDIACAHCTLPVPTALVRTNAAQQFCCAGCETAYTLRVARTGRTYDEFDHPAFAALHVRPTHDGLSQVELYLEGIHCASCVWLVERVPLLVPGVARAELDVRRSRAIVAWDANATPLSQVARTLDTLGYPPHPFRGVARDAVRRGEDRRMLVRIGVAGAIAGNVMLFAFALYSGELAWMDPAHTRFFRWLSMALTLPTLAWPGRVFFTGALAALRTRTLHMDLPIAIALAAGFVRGAINTITDSGPIYFDGLALLTFALLVGRFLQQRGQRLATDSAELLYALTPSIARVADTDGSVRDVPTEAVLPGMVLDVRAGETFAADGVLTTAHTTVNAALLTGESQPADVREGDTVFAGTLNVAAPARVRVTEAGETSRVARILQQVESSSDRRAPVVLAANRTWGVKTAMHSTTALDDAIALLVVTCPCALALATPLAVTMAVGRAARGGVLVKGGDALEQLAKPGTLVLDKTGTLTEGRHELVSWVGEVNVRPLVHALELGSSHPLADAVRRAWSNAPWLAQPLPSVAHAEHVIGGGLRGTVSGHDVLVGSPGFVRAHAARGTAATEAAIDALDPTLTPVLVALDGVIVAAGGFGDRIRDDAATALSALRARGWRTVMASGDTPFVAQAVGARLGFAPNDVHGAMSPEGKLALVTALQQQGGHVVMVGDGVNDAAAIAAANVGIGVHGGAEACLATADVFLARPGLTPLRELIEGAERTTRVIRRNFAFSLAYNAVGGGLAIVGLLTPLIAAVLMPLSSLTVVIASWHGRTFESRGGPANPRQ